jgi:integrase
MWDAGYFRCSCPIVIRGTLHKKEIRVSTAKYLPPGKARNLEAARELARIWGEQGFVSHLPDSPPHTPTPTIDDKTSGCAASDEASIEQAVMAFMADGEARGLAGETVSKRRTVFKSSLLNFAALKGLRFARELDLAVMREWRASWNVNSLVRSKRQKSAIGFLWFCERAGWLPRNAAHEITVGLGKVQVKKTPTGYFPPEEYKKILDATYLYSDRPSIDKHNSLDRHGGDRIRAVTELMRWTIGDAVTLEKSRLVQDPNTGMWSIILIQKKTGVEVYCPIPPNVAEMLRDVPASQKGNANGTWFFWTGNGKRKTIVTNWERSYSKLFALADIRDPNGGPKRCHPHMLRDTFAIESLLGGVPLVEVSKLLGHTSIKTTEESYMPWVRARQSTLNTLVMESWAKQGILNAVQEKRRRARVVPIKVAS